MPAQQNAETGTKAAGTGQTSTQTPGQQGADSTPANVQDASRKIKPARASKVTGYKAIFLTHTDMVLRLKKAS